MTEEELAAKPPIEDMPTDEDVENEAEPGEQDVPEQDFMDPNEAHNDETIDDQEEDNGG